MLWYDDVECQKAVFFRGSKLSDRARSQDLTFIGFGGSQRIQHIRNLKPVFLREGLYLNSCRRRHGVSSYKTEGPINRNLRIRDAVAAWIVFESMVSITKAALPRD